MPFARVHGIPLSKVQKYKNHLDRIKLGPWRILGECTQVKPQCTAGIWPGAGVKTNLLEPMVILGALTSVGWR